MRAVRAGRWALGFSLSALALLPTAVRAGNDDGVLIGNPAAMTGGAVVATVDDGSALWYNPAGIGRVTTDSADVTASVMALRYYRSPDLVRGVGTEAAEDVVEFLSIPSALSYVRPLSETVHVGLGVFSPAASDIIFRSDLDAQRMGVEGKLSLAIVDTESRYVGVLGVAWTPHPTFRVGLALRGGYSSTFSTTQSSLRFIDPTTDWVSAYADTTSAKLGDFGFTLGVAWDPIPQLSFGVSVETPTVALVGFTRVSTIDVFAETNPDGTIIDADNSDDRSLDVQADPLEPAKVRMGAAYRLDRGRIEVNVDLITPLSSPNLGVDRHLQANVRVGGVHEIGDGLELGVGLFTDLSGHNGYGFEGGTDFVGGTVALHTEHRLGLAEEEESDEIVFSTYIGLRYAYGFGQVEGLLLDPTTPDFVQSVPAHLDVHEFMLHLGSAVSF